MSVVAWDGRSLAADRQAVYGDQRVCICKMRKVPGRDVLAWLGDHEKGLYPANWYADGAKPELWPDFQGGDGFCTLILATTTGVFMFMQLPMRINISEPFMAWGEGSAYALGAMARGATARHAVEAAERFCIHCGFGVDEAVPTEREMFSGERG